MSKEEVNDAFVVTTPYYNSYNPFASFRQFINFKNKGVYGAYERPPYPIIIDVPTLRDVLSNLTFSDFVLGGTVYGTGVMWSYVVSKPFPLIMQRLVVYHGLSHMFFFSAGCFMFMCSYRRLTGFGDNGLRWRIPEDKLKK